MLIDFKVSNHYSFYSQVEFSMEASNEKNVQEYIIEKINKEKLLKLALIYGANASGKTNLLKAISDLTDLVVEKRQKKIDFISPFKFNKYAKNEPTIFDITFIKNNIKFNYFLQIEQGIITAERLEAYLTSQPSLIFFREKNKKDFDLQTGYKIKLKRHEVKILKSFTNAYSTILSSVPFLNIKNELLNIAFEWFDKIDFLERDETDLMNFEYYKEFFEKNIDAKNFVINLLQKSDFNIIDFDFQETNDKNYKYEPIFKHKANNITTWLEEYEESEGTLTSFGLFCYFAELIFDDIDILLIDELENSLHPNLLPFFINAFLYYTKDKKKQIIATTHNINLLSEKFIRKDIIWFTEKKNNAETELFSLYDFNIRKDLSFFKAYKNGKFGAIPLIDIIY